MTRYQKQIPVMHVVLQDDIGQYPVHCRHTEQAYYLENLYKRLNIGRRCDGLELRPSVLKPVACLEPLSCDHSYSITTLRSSHPLRSRSIDPLAPLCERYASAIETITRDHKASFKKRLLCSLIMAAAAAA